MTPSNPYVVGSLLVVVKLYLYFKEAAGRSEFEFPDGVTPMDVLEELGKRYPAIARAIERNDFIVLVNGAPVPDNDLRRIKLKDRDIMELLPPASGGFW